MQMLYASKTPDDRILVASDFSIDWTAVLDPDDARRFWTELGAIIEPSGLPQSALGGLHPELRAQITHATATLGDFHTEDAEYIKHGRPEIRPDYVVWAYRLEADLRGLLDAIERLSK